MMTWTLVPEADARMLSCASLDARGTCASDKGRVLKDCAQSRCNTPKLTLETYRLAFTQDLAHEALHLQLIAAVADIL